jgi:hypothetical protein
VPAKIQCLVTLLLMALLVIVVVDCLVRWSRALTGRAISPAHHAADPALAPSPGAAAGA